jgi:hypothetical protein
MPAVPLYKFLHREHLPLLLEGQTLKICSSIHYRREYERSADKNPKINDPDEGRVYIAQDRAIGPGGTPQEYAFLRELTGLQVGPGWGGHARFNAVIRDVTPFHMLCFGHGDFAQLVRTFCTQPKEVTGFRPYTACVRVFNSMHLAAALADATVSLPGAPPQGGVPFKWLFDASGGHPVEYKPVGYTAREEAREPDPWVKGLDFADQQEFRLGFLQTKTGPFASRTLPDQLIAHLPILRQLIEPVDLRPYLGGSLDGG